MKEGIETEGEKGTKEDENMPTGGENTKTTTTPVPKSQLKGERCVILF